MVIWAGTAPTLLGRQVDTGAKAMLARCSWAFTSKELLDVELCVGPDHLIKPRAQPVLRKPANASREDRVELVPLLVVAIHNCFFVIAAASSHITSRRRAND